MILPRSKNRARRGRPSPRSFLRCRLLASILCVLAATTAGAAEYDADEALAISQAAVGTKLKDYRLVDRFNQPVDLRELTGRPLLVSMIFTSCHHVCPMITKNLAAAVDAAREALGEDSFRVATIGFDAANDTAEAMRAFAREQGVQADDWWFLSGDSPSIEALATDTGFRFYTSPRGFDHINQVTIVDADGVVYRQVYGVDFELPWLVEPLKQLVFNRPEPGAGVMSNVVDRLRLFCTVYNPASGRYEFDNSLFIQMAIGFMIVLSTGIFLWRGLRDRHRLQ